MFAGITPAISKHPTSLPMVSTGWHNLQALRMPHIRFLWSVT